jgi:peroxiredoxin
MAMARQLNVGDGFPPYQVKTTVGDTLRILEDSAGEYSVLLFYRGDR